MITDRMAFNSWFLSAGRGLFFMSSRFLAHAIVSLSVILECEAEDEGNDDLGGQGTGREGGGWDVRGCFAAGAVVSVITVVIAVEAVGAVDCKPFSVALAPALSPAPTPAVLVAADVDVKPSPSPSGINNEEDEVMDAYMRFLVGMSTGSAGNSGDDVTVLSRHCKYCAVSDRLPFNPL